MARVANILFQPLLEGLALFCEHDLIAGENPVISRVTQRVAPLFTKGRIQSLLKLDSNAILQLAALGGADRAFSIAHTAMLQQARRSKQWLERKTLLLGQPIGGNNRYLLGYLAVKGMHATLASVCQALVDPELFFVSVVHHFMSDQALTEILLRLRKKITDPAEAYLWIGKDTGDLFTRFQDLCDELYRNPGRIAKTAMECATSSAELGHQPDANLQFLMGFRTVGTINIAWPRLMKHRLDFRFSFQDVIIRLAKDGEAAVCERTTGKEICRITSVHSCRPAIWESGKEYIEFEGSVEGVHLRDIRTTVVCILGHNGLIAVLDCETRKWNLPKLVEMLDDMPSAVAVEGAMHAFAEWQSRTKNCGEISEMIEHYEQQACDAVDLLYPQLACNGWVADRRRRLVDSLKDRGVLGMYEASDESTISELSLAAGIGSLVEAVTQSMGLHRDEFNELVSRLNGISESRSGFEPFIISGELIRSRL